MVVHVSSCVRVCFISVLVCAPLFLRCLILRFQPAPARAAPSARRGAGDGVGARGRAGPDANREVHGGRRRACLVERRETRETRADRETRAAPLYTKCQKKLDLNI